MLTSFSLISLNIEKKRHLAQVLPFLKRQPADVICLQEVATDDFTRFQSELNYEGFYSPRVINRDGMESGTAILTRLPITKTEIASYDDFTEIPPELREKLATRPTGEVLSLTIEISGQPVRIATTHFTWTPNGEANDEQRVNVKKLLKILAQWPEFVLCGDFNAPRGREIFTIIADHYEDNIPPGVITTLDGNLHRAGKLDYVVDGLFTTPDYKATDVTVTDGLSDHCAIWATISVNRE